MFSRNNNEMIKIVYFDEFSALDLLNISNGGEVEMQEKSKNDRTVQGEAKLLTEIGVGKKLLGLAKAFAEISASAGVSSASEKTIQKTISNTVLTDYLNSDFKNRVKILDNYEVYPDKESFAYLKLFAPYLQMFNIEQQGLYIEKLNEVLEDSKGYYELVGNNRDDTDEKHILRFNIRAFRNNYGLIDLTKMNLVFHVIEVGYSDLNGIKFKNEFQIDNSIVQVEDLLDENQEAKHCIIYDVLLAGVCAAGDSND